MTLQRNCIAVTIWFEFSEELSEMRTDRFKAYRVKRDYTQESLALELGTDKKAISRWESGQYSPNVETLKEISRLLIVSVDYLLGLSDNPTPQTRVDNLTEEELEVINAMRQGERMEAIKIIAAAKTGS